MRFSAIVLSLALASCATVQADEADPHNLGIEIGRWGYMLTQIAEHTDGADPPYVEGRDLDVQRNLARELREVVWTYNLQRSKICAAGVLTEASCGPAYAPAWLTEANMIAPSFPEIARRSTAVGDVVMPFWDKVCADAASRVADEEEKRLVCPME
jgi:hypothetical protein